jgi:hypothetical protein
MTRQTLHEALAVAGYTTWLRRRELKLKSLVGAK